MSTIEEVSFNGPPWRAGSRGWVGREGAGSPTVRPCDRGGGSGSAIRPEARISWTARTVAFRLQDRSTGIR